MKNSSNNIRLSLLLIFLSVICLADLSKARDSVWVWYGNVELEPVTANIGDTLFVDVFAQTDDSAYVENMLLVMGINDQYIDTAISTSQGSVYYPLTEWDYWYFSNPEGSPPNPTGWSSQSFIGWARLLNLDSPLLHVGIPWKIMTMAVITVDNPELVGQTAHALGPGLNSQQGPSNAGDSLGGAGYEVIEYFCEVTFFQEAPETGFISGTVENQTGDAVQGVKVKIVSSNDSTATDNEGHYALATGPGTYSLLFQHDAYLDTTVTDVNVTLNDTTTVDVVLRALPGGTVFGNVVDTTGLAIEGVTVSDGSGLNQVQTNTEGNYSLDLPQGSYVINFTKTGYLDTSAIDITVFVDTDRELNMTMTPSLNYDPDTPAQITIMQNYPNPFNNGTIIEFELDRPLNVVVEIFDILGRKVQTVANMAGDQGINSVTWFPGEIASGIYFCRVSSSNTNKSRAMLYIR